MLVPAEVLALRLLSAAATRPQSKDAVDGDSSVGQRLVSRAQALSLGLPRERDGPLSFICIPSSYRLPQEFIFRQSSVARTRKGSREHGGATSDGETEPDNSRNGLRIESVVRARVHHSARRVAHLLHHASATVAAAGRRARLRIDGELAPPLHHNHHKHDSYGGGGAGAGGEADSGGTGCSVEGSVAVAPGLVLSGVLGAAVGGWAPVWGAAVHGQAGRRAALAARFFNEASAGQQLTLQAEVEAGPRSTLGVGLAVRQEEWGQPQAEARLQLTRHGLCRQRPPLLARAVSLEGPHDVAGGQGAGSHGGSDSRAGGVSFGAASVALVLGMMGDGVSRGRLALQRAALLFSVESGELQRGGTKKFRMGCP